MSEESTPEPETVAPVSPAQAPAVTLPPLPQQQAASVAINESAAKSKVTDALTVSFFDDDSFAPEAKAYSTYVTLHGHKVYIREMTRAEFNDFRKQEAAFKAEGVAIAADADALNAEVPTTPEEIKDRIARGEAIEARSEDSTQRQMAVADAIIERHVADWELPSVENGIRPCTPESRARLHPSLKSELALMIVQSGSLTKQDRNF